SSVRLEAARPAGEPDWPRYEVPRSLGSEAPWKRTVRDAVSRASVLADGPVALQLALTVGPLRSAPGMWKRSIDGLEPLLGRTYPSREWNPLDGRIVRLGLHRAIDDRFGHDAGGGHLGASCARRLARACVVGCHERRGARVLLGGAPREDCPTGALARRRPVHGRARLRARPAP
ncbi:MAG TPA: hypothetical protein VLA19_30960, partial [Herpetosiphonaceae bacterium]|nr:hypothetical protein [Herpetosiphonaceae bacterium]